MKTIIKEEKGRYWVRMYGRYVGTFDSYFQAWNTDQKGNPKPITMRTKDGRIKTITIKMEQ